ncbi:MAG TPA: hypothetical protein VFH00_06015 [Candidatus Nitrosotalea sp.]|nr:hypothetical protein [Candidatus Nitrosotalea sp.]
MSDVPYTPPIITRFVPPELLRHAIEAAGNAAGDGDGLDSTGDVVGLGIGPGLAASGDGDGDLAASEPLDAPIPHPLTHTSIAARHANLRILICNPNRPARTPLV